MTAGPTSSAEAFELFVELRRRGERVDPAEFAARFPEYEAELAPALDALVSLEDSAADAVRDDALPERVGPYRVVRQIGRGGMGVVLEAVEEPLGRRVALKILPPENLESAVARERFRREAKLASQLEHSGIATIFGAGVDADQPWIAMRYVEGESLAHGIARARAAGERCVRMDPRTPSGREAALRVAACIAGVARALQFAHDRGIVHRDVKPSNVVITPDGAPVLLDFGLAIGEEADSATLTRTGQTAGTPAYMPPELVSGERARPDALGDVYALGVTLYECLTLRRPFEGPTQIALYRAIASGAASGVRVHHRDIPRDLAVVVATAMERDPARRYSSAAAFASDLEACAAGRPILARPVPLHGRVLRWARREPRQALLAGLLAAASVGLALFGGSWWSSRDQVLAAARVADDQAFEAALQNGFGNLNPRWHELSKSSFERALAIRPGDPQALAGLALVEMYVSPEAAQNVLRTAPATLEFDALRALARGEHPIDDYGPQWFQRASATEMFIDGMRLKKQLELTPPSGRPPIARQCVARFDEAIRRAPTARFLYHLELAHAARETHDEALMRSAAAALVALWPDQEKALYDASTLLFEIDPRAAITLLEKRIALFPEDPEPYGMIAAAHCSIGDFDAAQRSIEIAIARDPTSPWQYNTLSAILYQRGCMEEAHAALARAVELRPPLFEAWANLAIMEARFGEPADAEFVLRCTLDLDPGASPLRLALVQFLEQRGALTEALAEAEAVLGLDPGNPRAFGRVATVQMALGNHAESLAAALAGLEVAPDDASLAAQVDEAMSALDSKD